MTTTTATPGPTPAPLVRCVTAQNPSPMTLAGTNTYVVAAPDSDAAVVVDPGPEDDVAAHLERVRAAAEGRRIALILVTHRHADHTGGVDAFHAATGAPVRAADPDWCRGGAAVLTPDERIDAAGTPMLAWHTPGHTSDSYSFAVPDAGAHGAVITGDTILGSGTTMLDHPDGTLTDYLASLRRLEAAGPLTVLPAHGPVPGPLDVVARDYRHHREGRLEQIRAALAALPETEAATITPEDLAPRIYPGLTGTVARVAVQTVAAHLRHLREG
ncbi:MBL fold metallo-hydrolase [Micrococcus luteus]|uniref:MBL fold metallo-hydrolase n=1 Tax=Micrococcus TaxID=1269 RepID=UPI0008A238A2|nr:MULTISPECIES: MBL fold metallo-hydrolase [unclassified Micrococcus]MCV7449170.1 MBL fold metallo-hydrolase [Micrococcus luteus]MCV7554162.1 MBL fold metallo-hydrolase [Micrococcus luteus]MCV7601730.1 MBL fold metallo-hydrolase [Micrococcus luteus]OFS17315.1 Zn-dependent hydrolase [Micrococcus sp. HMSC31B01]